jgi:hypothetical protein
MSKVGSDSFEWQHFQSQFVTVSKHSRAGAIRTSVENSDSQRNPCGGLGRTEIDITSTSVAYLRFREVMYFQIG